MGVFDPSYLALNSLRAAATTTHRDERAVKRRKIRAVRERSTTDTSVDLEEHDPAPSAVTGTRIPPTIPNSTLLEHIATSRFFHHYVSADRTFCRLDLDYTTFIIDNATMRAALAECIIALGILTLPRRSEASCMAARLRYARALRLTNHALRDKAEAKSDEILMAVILLSFFEVGPCSFQSSVVSVVLTALPDHPRRRAFPSQLDCTP